MTSLWDLTYVIITRLCIFCIHWGNVHDNVIPTSFRTSLHSCSTFLPAEALLQLWTRGKSTCTYICRSNEKPRMLRVLSTKPWGHCICIHTPTLWALSLFQIKAYRFLLSSVVHVLIHGCSKMLSFHTLGGEKRKFWEWIFWPFLELGDFN